MKATSCKTRALPSKHLEVRKTDRNCCHENGHAGGFHSEIFANQMAGVAIGRRGASRVTGNTISDGNGGSLCRSVHSKGHTWAKSIHQDPGSAMQVPE
eukprot:6186180-Pleurochrysis_carterae.AAC.3